MQRNALILGMILLLLGSIANPLSMGNQSVLRETSEVNIQYTNSTISPYDCYDVSEIPMGYDDIPPAVDIDEKTVTTSIPKHIDPQTPQTLNLMNSSWPMYCHDLRHTGRSPYSTINTWDEIWRFRPDRDFYVTASPVIDKYGVIYIEGLADFYALYPDGTIKWKYEGLGGSVWSAPAIDVNGTIYFGTIYSDGDFYAINSNGTLKWKYHNGNNVFSSPAIDNNGIIYFGDENDYIYALRPNGTLRWRYKTGHVVYSSPAIGDDGTIYCGSHDTYLYALYPDNGSLKWRYKTGNWIRTSPCIADDGTIYCVSLDDHLYAIHPNGTLKWKTDMGEGGTSPTIGQDGTIYAGYAHLRAFYPDNGSIKWTLPLGSGRRIKGATPCHSVEDIIIFGTHIGDYGGGEIMAVNPDGTERWRKKIANEYVDSAPAIGADGTVYIGSSLDDHGSNYGYLYAFGMANLTANAHGPYYGLTQEPVDFQGSASGGYWPHTYHWEFGDGNTSDEQNPSHQYAIAGNYTVTLIVMDNETNTSSDTTWAWVQDGNQPPDIPVIDGHVKGNSGVLYEYTFQTSDPEGKPIWYYVEWGDGSNSGWKGPYASGTVIKLSHLWYEEKTYVVRCKARDVYGDEGDWGLLEVQIPVAYSYQYPLLWWLQSHFPLLARLLTLFGGLV